MTLSERQRRFTHLLGQLLVHVYASGDEATLGDVWRSNDRLMCPYTPEKSHTYQELLAYNGRSKVSGDGAHQMRLGADVLLWHQGTYVTTRDLYRPYGEWWEALDPTCRWGGRFGVPRDQYAAQIGFDPQHFEVAP